VTADTIAANAVDRSVASQVLGLAGAPSRGQRSAAIAKASRAASSGEVEVAEEADQCSEDVSPLIAEGLLEDRCRSTTGRTSTAPPMRAAGIARPARSQRRGRRPRTATDERAVGRQRLVILHPHGGCRLGGLQLDAGADAGVSLIAL
jgi:hypothetical protein